MGHRARQQIPRHRQVEAPPPLVDYQQVDAHPRHRHRQARQPHPRSPAPHVADRNGRCHMAVQRDDGERDERDDRRLLEEQQPTDVHEHRAHGVAPPTRADQQDRISAHPRHRGRHRQRVQPGRPPRVTRYRQWREQRERQRRQQNRPPTEDHIQGPQQGQRRQRGQDHQAQRRAHPVQRGQPGDRARQQERCGHHVAVVVVEQVGRRQQGLRACPADQNQVVPVEIATERQHRPHGQMHRDEQQRDAGGTGMHEHYRG